MIDRIMEVRIIEDKIEIESIFPLMAQLRPHLTLKEFLEINSIASKMDNYTLVGAFEGLNCIGLMGLRINVDMVRGKHIYIDDLVVDESIRSKGVGAKLLHFTEDFTKSKDCKVLRFCTGIKNERGKSFYEKLGWRQTALAYTKKI